MGGSFSGVNSNQSLQQVFVSNTDINEANQQINSSESSAIIQNTNICTAGASAGNNGTISFIAKGGGTVNSSGINQSAQSTITSQCLQEAINKYNSSAGMTNSIMSLLTANYNSKALSNLDSHLANAAESGSLPLGISASMVNSNSSQNTNIKNNTYVHINNLVSNIVSNNFKAANLQQCSPNAMSSNNLNVNAEAIGKGSTVNTGLISQESIVKSFSECNQFVQNISNTTSELQNIINTVNNVSSESYAEGSGNQVITNSSSISGFSLFGLGSIISWIIVIALVIVGIIAIVIGYRYLKKNNSSSNQTSGQTSSQVNQSGGWERFI